MYHQFSALSRVAFLVFAVMIWAPAIDIPVADAAQDQRLQPFHWYEEHDVINHTARLFERNIPRGRVAVIEWITFRASNVQCKLVGVLVQTTLKGAHALHTVVGVTDMGPSGEGRAFGLSEQVRAYAGPGTTVAFGIIPEQTPDGSCPGDGLDLTVTGHYERP
jgi:hypothetical protein